MATKEEYIAVAPYVMGIGDFAATAIETKLAAIPVTSEPAAPKDPTKTNIVALFNELFTGVASPEIAIAKAGGLMAIATKYGMTRQQCLTCIAEFKAMKALYEKSK